MAAADDLHALRLAGTSFIGSWSLRGVLEEQRTVRDDDLDLLTLTEIPASSWQASGRVTSRARVPAIEQEHGRLYVLR
jgi:hypothetical protein